MSHAPTVALDARHRQIRDACSSRGLDGLVVTTLPNVLYLTNFTGSAAIVVLAPDTLHFLTDFRYVTAVESRRGTPEECPSLRLETVSASYDEALATVLERYPGKRVGIEAAHLTVSRFDWLRARLAGRPAPELVPTENIVEQARLVKDEHEIATLREAGRRLSEVARGVIGEDVRAGRTEQDVALAIDTRIRRAGFEKTSFDTIVASGPNAALPHARPGERRLSEGDSVVLDFGGVYASYCVDLTRTVSVGAPGAELCRVHAAVREAHDRAIAAVRPGILASEVDRAARDYLASAGLGEAFGHGTGHGLGIEVHEAPRVTRRRDDGTVDQPLARGMVFTIEPGAYVPGWGGVRIEDDVLVTGNGVELLTEVDTALASVPA